MQHVHASQTPPETPDIETDPSHIALWMIRKWVAAHKGSDRARATLDYAMTEAKAPRLQPALDAVMETLTHHARRRIAVLGSCSSIISRDEQMLLDALTLAQADPKVETGLILQPMLDRAGAAAIGRKISLLASQLNQDGVRLVQPVRTTGVPIQSGDPMSQPPVLLQAQP